MRAQFVKRIATGIGLAGLLLGAVALSAATLDIDDNGSVAAQTDGQLVLRYLLGFRGTDLTTGLIGADAGREAAAIEGYLGALDLALDVDGDGRADALSDGLLILRSLLGRTGPQLTDGTLSPAATRDAAGIADRIAELSVDADAGPTAPLNDTGIDWCADGGTNNLDCPVDGYPGQDAQSGRDVTHNDPNDGHAGFSFTKLDANGNPLAASATSWACVRDNVTGLIWEVKTDDGGLRDKYWTYSWYNPDATANGGSAGYADYGNNCFDASRCDTDKYVADINAVGLCGASDWRLPADDELLSIVSDDRTLPSIDTDYFPNTQSSWFWSSSPYAGYSASAWYVSFGDGYVGINLKYFQRYVRLVRAGQ